jgi:hypothetical protein
MKAYGSGCIDPRFIRDGSSNLKVLAVVVFKDCLDHDQPKTLVHPT